MFPDPSSPCDGSGNETNPYTESGIGNGLRVHLCFVNCERCRLLTAIHVNSSEMHDIVGYQITDTGMHVPPTCLVLFPDPLCRVGLGTRGVTLHQRDGNETTATAAMMSLHRHCIPVSRDPRVFPRPSPETVLERDLRVRRVHGSLYIT